jgi:formylglycine-generating enzyme required for sulfatase activity
MPRPSAAAPTTSSNSTPGGRNNTIGTNAVTSTIGGGTNNTIESTAKNSTIGGGDQNTIQTNAFSSAIGGGEQNAILTNAQYATISGGTDNTIAGSYAALGGGYENSASGAAATIGGGRMNNAAGYRGTVGGGYGNSVSNNYSTVGGGYSNSATNNYSTVPGGNLNVAGGQYSFAAGNRARATHQGSFVWADSTAAYFTSTSNNQFLIRASGGVGIGTSNPQSALHVAGTATADRFVATAAELPATVIPVLGMVWIKPGTFIMGSPTNTPLEVQAGIEWPQTVVTLTRGFWMGVHEVTQGEYQDVTGHNPSEFTGDTNRPVERVYWYDATNYCGRLTIAEQTAGRIPGNWTYRLPTEAEWEYCCRAGATTTRFGYGDDSSYAALGNYAWYEANSGGTTHPVEQKLANPWGLMDMHGNVLEWCQDWFGAYSGGSVTDPQGPETGSKRVIRGGTYGWSAVYCRSACRIPREPNIPWWDQMVGFRVVLAPVVP